jgi:DNA-damage-inducible protein J
MSTTTMLHVRVDEETKNGASAALNAMGLSMSEAVRVFLHRVAVEQAIPFDLKVPNATTRAAMEEARKMKRARYRSGAALFDALAGSDAVARKAA